MQFKERSKLFGGTRWYVGFISTVILIPYFTIWSLNLLFHLEIPFNVETLAAALWLSVVVGAVNKMKPSSD